MRPWWLILLLLFLLTPMFFFFGVADAAPAESLLRGLLQFYPVYCIADAICAWICYPQRKEITWILVGILILSHIGVYILWTEGL